MIQSTETSHQKIIFLAKKIVDLLSKDKAVSVNKKTVEIDYPFIHQYPAIMEKVASSVEQLEIGKALVQKADKNNAKKFFADTPFETHHKVFSLLPTIKRPIVSERKDFYQAIRFYLNIIPMIRRVEPDIVAIYEYLEKQLFDGKKDLNLLYELPLDGKRLPEETRRRIDFMLDVFAFDNELYTVAVRGTSLCLYLTAHNEEELIQKIAHHYKTSAKEKDSLNWQGIIDNKYRISPDKLFSISDKYMNKPWLLKIYIEMLTIIDGKLVANPNTFLKAAKEILQHEETIPLVPLFLEKVKIFPSFYNNALNSFKNPIAFLGVIQNMDNQIPAIKTYFDVAKKAHLEKEFVHFIQMLCSDEKAGQFLKELSLDETKTFLEMSKTLKSYTLLSHKENSANGDTAPLYALYINKMISSEEMANAIANMWPSRVSEMMLSNKENWEKDECVEKAFFQRFADHPKEIFDFINSIQNTSDKRQFINRNWDSFLTVFESEPHLAIDLIEKTQLLHHFAQSGDKNAFFKLQESHLADTKLLDMLMQQFDRQGETVYHLLFKNQQTNFISSLAKSSQNIEAFYTALKEIKNKNGLSVLEVANPTFLRKLSVRCPILAPFFEQQLASSRRQQETLKAAILTEHPKEVSSEPIPASSVKTEKTVIKRDILYFPNIRKDLENCPKEMRPLVEKIIRTLQETPNIKSLMKDKVKRGTAEAYSLGIPCHKKHRLLFKLGSQGELIVVGIGRAEDLLALKATWSRNIQPLKKDNILFHD